MEARLNDPAPDDAPANEAPRLLGRRAFLAVSFLSLFLEVLLIRWCGAEVRILAYLKNLTLLACFLGLGLGYAASRRRPLGLRWTFAATAALVGLAHPAFASYPMSVRGLSKLLNFGDTNTWSMSTHGVLEFVMGISILCVLYSLLAFAFVPLGQALGAHFRAVPADERLRHYTGNVVASLAGVATFGALSWVEAPPLVWFAIAGVAALLAVPFRPAELAAIVVGTAVIAGLLIDSERAPPILENDVTGISQKAQTRVIETRWSPYQKIQLVEESFAFDRPQGSGLMDGGLGTPQIPRLEWKDYSAYVNGEWYSRVGTVDLEEARTRATYAQNMSLWANQAILRLPYRLAKGRGAALLLGAGMGRDAATALAEHVAHVDCIEIEGRFIEWGKKYNPQHAYTDPRVDIHVDDARRFLRSCPPGTYDLVIFCYLDAHSLTSNFTNTNLDSYVYTRESIAEAKRALAPDGVLALGFWSPRPFIYKRIEALLEEAFGPPPIRLSESLFVTGLEPMPVLRTRALRDPLVAPCLSSLASADPGKLERPIDPTTDDWPFFYVERPVVPWVYRAVLVAILLLSAAGVRLAVGRVQRIDPHFLFLGAAFMLVETWSISRASLVYGATWYVSSAVIASLLGMVLLANAWVEKRGTVALARAFPLLLGALVAATLLDPSRFLDLPRALQLILAAPIYAVPFCFASAIFATSFTRAEHVDEALASNLLGSVLGGALECLAFATGLRSLGFVAIGLYALAWATARR